MYEYCIIVFLFTYLFRDAIALMSLAENSSITMLKELPTSFACSTITSINAGTFLVSTYDNTRPIRTIDIHGKVNFIKHKCLPDKTYKMDKCACTYIPATKTLVLTDSEQHTVYLCDMTSQDGLEIRNNKIRSPRRACVGPYDTVYLCSQTKDSIVQLSERGDVLTSINVGMRYPYAVSFSRDGTRLVVANCAAGPKMIKLFQVAL